MNRNSSENRDPNRGSPAIPNPEFSWIALVIGAAMGAIAGHLVWRKPIHVAVFTGAIGYLIGALIDRSRRR